MSKKTYRIGDGVFSPSITVELEVPPPCLYCGTPVIHPSMDGPLVCGPCDMGKNADGTRWTADQGRERVANFGKMIALYRQQQEKP